MNLFNKNLIICCYLTIAHHEYGMHLGEIEYGSEDVL